MIIQFLHERRLGHPHPLAVRVLELAHSMRSLIHPEVDFVGVLAHNLKLDILCVTHVSEITLGETIIDYDLGLKAQSLPGFLWLEPHTRRRYL